MARAIIFGIGLVAGSLAAEMFVATPVRAQAPVGDSVTIRQVAPGVTMRRIARAEGPVVIHLLELDLRSPELEVRAVRACDRLTGRERPTSIVRRLRAAGLDVVAALNSGFFDLEGGTGTSESNVVVDGEIVKGVELTESPFDRFDNAHSQFAVNEQGRPLIDRFRLTGHVVTARGRWLLGAINGAPVADEVALYTEWADAPPRFPRALRSAGVPLTRVSAHGDTIRYRVATALPSRPDTSASAGAAALLVGSGRAAAGVAALRPGDRVTVVAAFAPARGMIRSLVGGWPRIVRGGVSVALAADSAEGTFPKFSAARHPRSAVGISRDSSTLYLAAVDGRRAWSVGMTLDELARAMIALGAYDVLNLDGGGSTALVVGDSLVNTPSDTTGERPVGDAIVITRRPPSQTGYLRRVRPAATVVAGCVTRGTRDPDRLPAAAAKAP